MSSPMTGPLTAHKYVFYCSLGGKLPPHRKELRERDDDRCPENGDQARGDLRRGHTPRRPRGGGCGPSGQRSLGELSVPTTAKGYKRLLCWVEGFGPVRCAGIEGTSSYGAGLARYFKAQGIEVPEVERPKRRQRSSPRNAIVSSPAPLARKRVGAYPHASCWLGSIRSSP